MKTETLVKSAATKRLNELAEIQRKWKSTEHISAHDFVRLQKLRKLTATCARLGLI